MSVRFYIQVKARALPFSEQLDVTHFQNAAEVTYFPDAETFGYAVVPNGVYDGLHWSNVLAEAWGIAPDAGGEGTLIASRDFTTLARFRSQLARLIQCTYEAVDESVVTSGYGGRQHLVKGAVVLSTLQAIASEMWDTHDLSVVWY